MGGSISNEAAAAVRDAVSDFRKGNEKLSIALKMMEDHQEQEEEEKNK